MCPWKQLCQARQLSTLKEATKCLWGCVWWRGWVKTGGDTATQGTRKCFCPKNIPSKQSISTAWFGSQKELILMMEMFQVAIFLLSLYHYTTIWLKSSSLIMFYRGISLNLLLHCFKICCGSRFVFWVAIICSLGWSVLSDLLCCSTSNLTP